MSSLGKKIRQLRKERKMTQQELAANIVTASMVSQIESDRAMPSTKVLEQISNRLGVAVSFFIDDLQQKTDQSSTYRRAKTLMDRNKHREALPLLQSLIHELAPQFRETVIYTDLAVCFEKLDQLTEASDMYEQVVRVSLEKDDIPTAVHAYFNAGNLQRRLGRLAHARMLWFRASELLRRHPELTMPVSLKIEANLGRVYLMQKQFQQALERLTVAEVLAQQYASNSLDHAIIHHSLATTFVAVGDYPRALTHTEQALHLYETNSYQRGINQCLVNQGFIYRHQGEYEMAIRHLTECINYREVTSDRAGLANALGERARCYYELQEMDAVIEDCTRALRLQPSTDESIEILQTLALAYISDSRAEEALRVAQQGLSITGTEDLPHFVLMRTIECKSLSLLGQRTQSVLSAGQFADFVLEHVI